MTGNSGDQKPSFIRSQVVWDLLQKEVAEAGTVGRNYPQLDEIGLSFLHRLDLEDRTPPEIVFTEKQQRELKKLLGAAHVVDIEGAEMALWRACNGANRWIFQLRKTGSQTALREQLTEIEKASKKLYQAILGTDKETQKFLYDFGFKKYGTHLFPFYFGIQAARLSRACKAKIVGLKKPGRRDGVPLEAAEDIGHGLRRAGIARNQSKPVLAIVAFCLRAIGETSPKSKARSVMVQVVQQEEARRRSQEEMRKAFALPEKEREAAIDAIFARARSSDSE